MEDLPEILDSLAGGPPVSRLDTIDPALKEITFALLENGCILSRLLKKTHLPRCAQSPLSDVQNSTPPFVDLSRASHLSLFEQPADRICLAHCYKESRRVGPALTHMRARIDSPVN